MEENERVILRREKSYIARELATTGKFQDVAYEFKENGLIPPNIFDSCMRSEETITSKMTCLLNYLIDRNLPGSLATFSTILSRLSLYDLAKRLTSRPRRESDERDLNLPGYHGGASPMLGDIPRYQPLPRRDTQEQLKLEDNYFNTTRELKIQVKQAEHECGYEFKDDELYKNISMPRGLVFMANYKNFLNNEHPIREGSEIDVKNLTLLFTQMGYKIPKQHINLSKYETIKALRDFKNLKELEKVDSCIIIVMSHGRDDKTFYTSDNEYLSVKDVVERFNNRECEALKGKPKIFLFQYCRGREYDAGVPASALRNVMYKSDGVAVATDAAFTSEVIIDRDPTFTDMYIVYSTLEGFVSFRHPLRGSWLIEAICSIFMNHAHEEELEALMKRVSRYVRQNLSDDGNKQVCEFVQRAFDRHFFFNPQHINSTTSLSMRDLREPLENLEGAAAPLLRTTPRRHLRPTSWSRSTTPDPLEHPDYARRRNFSGASNTSEHEEIDPLSLSSENVHIHRRARRNSGTRRVFSESYNFFQPSFLQDPTADYNRSFSENVLENGSPGGLSEALESSTESVFTTASQDNVVQSRLQSIDTVDNPNHMFTVAPYNTNPVQSLSHKTTNLNTIGMEAARDPDSNNSNNVSPETNAFNKIEMEAVSNSDVNMNLEAEQDLRSESRHSIKRQLSIPSNNETLLKVNDVRRYLQINDSDEKLLEPLNRIESFIKKKKYAGKRRKKDDEANSLDY